MRTIFFGTTEFSCAMLETIITAGHEVVGVVTLPDRPASRGHKAIPTPVKEFALERGLNPIEADDLKDEGFAQTLRGLKADIGVVVSFKILPRAVFTAPRIGTLNVHPSLLPKLRGAAPVRWALIEGHTQTGVTTFLLDERVDTGDIILARPLPIHPDENYEELFARIIPLASEVLAESLKMIESGDFIGMPQDAQKATKAPKLKPEMCRIDWGRSAVEIHNLVRGLAPSPCAWTTFEGERYKIIRAKASEGSGSAGEIIACDPKGGLVVACGEGVLKILEIQAPGKRPLECGAFLCGCQLAEGGFFE
ncbi:MAG TPA: methionyl-tRNA formyltransferase [candidate division Zixibacteria bacterium]|nr:methionyl-tRNA formyltransferase [candidate division Zixibacteria bacterium]